jgi:hypothetical protein
MGPFLATCIGHRCGAARMHAPHAQLCVHACARVRACVDRARTHGRAPLRCMLRGYSAPPPRLSHPWLPPHTTHATDQMRRCEQPAGPACVHPPHACVRVRACANSNAHAWLGTPPLRLLCAAPPLCSPISGSRPTPRTQQIKSADSNNLLVRQRFGQGTLWIDSTLTDQPRRTVPTLRETGISGIVAGQPYFALNRIQPVFNASTVCSY